MNIDGTTATGSSLFYKSYSSVTDVNLTAEPADGYEFDYYDIGGTRNNNPSISLTVDCVKTVVAYFKVQQDCDYTIEPNADTYDTVGGSGSVVVTSLTGCDWTAVNNDDWIEITAGSSGNGNGIVEYTVTSNSSLDSRTSTIIIAGNTFTITQHGTEAGDGDDTGGGGGGCFIETIK